jgi:glycosyltransferase involved in cell wall biosynthesis
MKISVIIPTLNEEKQIAQVIQNIRKDIANEIIIVDGHSKDDTIKEAKKHLRPQKDKIIEQKGSGFGNAILQGAEIARGDILIIMDGDGSHDPALISELTEKVRRGYEFVIASRYAPGGRSENDVFILYWLGNRFFNWLTNTIHGTRVTDSLYFYIAISKEGYKKLDLRSSGYEMAIEMLVKAHRAGLRFAEVPAVEKKPRFPKSRINIIFDGFKIFKMIMRRYMD